MDRASHSTKRPVCRSAARLTALLLAGRAVCAETALRLLDGFTYPGPAEAGKTWQSKEGAPPVRISPGGLSFPCPFEREVDRVEEGGVSPKNKE